METGSYASNLRKAATSMMYNAVYKSEHKNFTIDTYHSLHVRAHNMLVDGELSLGDNIKITNFKNGIVESTSIMHGTFTSRNFPLNSIFNQ